MNTLILATFGTVALTIGIVTVSVLMIGLILLQKNRGSGLSGAFGGVGGHTAFGTKTGDFLTWVTVGLTAVFLLLSIAGNFVFDTSKPVQPSGAQSPAGSGLPEGEPITPGAMPPGAPAPAPIKGAAPIGGTQAMPMDGKPFPVKVNQFPTTQPS